MHRVLIAVCKLIPSYLGVQLSKIRAPRLKYRKKLTVLCGFEWKLFKRSFCWPLLPYGFLLNCVCTQYADFSTGEPSLLFVWMWVWYVQMFMWEHTCVNACACTPKGQRPTSGVFLITLHLSFWGRVSWLICNSWCKQVGWSVESTHLSCHLWVTNVHLCTQLITEVLGSHCGPSCLWSHFPVLLLYLLECSCLWLWSTYPVKSL